MSANLPDVSSLSHDQKVVLLDQLWESIARETPVYPVPDWLKAELDRRHEEYLRDPSQAISWEEARAEILREHGEAEDPSQGAA
jgi:putative addiction module component (TIGR02574 family)